MTPVPTLCLDFPLRSDFLVQIVIPREMYEYEAKRLCAFIMTLALKGAPVIEIPSSDGDEHANKS
jgi:hypothetical protein